MRPISWVAIFLIATVGWAVPSRATAASERPNVLFIAVDDLRTELGCYGNTTIQSPHIDRLAAEGMVFNRAWCQQAICMASRASLMSGLRPDSHAIYNCKALTDLAPDVLTLNRHFENNGYQIWSSGKIYHHASDRQAQFGDNYQSEETQTVGRGYLAPESIQIVKDYGAVYRETRNENANGRGPAFEAPDVPDAAYPDGYMTDQALQAMETLKKRERPFFMAVGFHKPHLPFNAPKPYWDLYDPARIEPAPNPFNSKDASAYFNNYNFGELRNYAGIPKGREPFSADLARQLKHGYYACVSYTDAQIGKLLDGLKRNGLDKNTIVVLWGDHGWKLGEHGKWCKHTQYAIDNHVPLLVKAPGVGRTGKTDALVEFVDIYPTLCELAGLELPAHLQGTSFAPVLKNPERPWKEGAISVYPFNTGNPQKRILGFAIQTQRYRYTEWIQEATGDVVDRDLFDHQNDPDENESIAHRPENADRIQTLSRLLDKGKGWKAIAANLR